MYDLEQTFHRTFFVSSLRHQANREKKYANSLLVKAEYQGQPDLQTQSSFFQFPREKGKPKQDNAFVMLSKKVVEGLARLSKIVNEKCFLAFFF